MSVVFSDKCCETCGLLWMKNHIFAANGDKKHVGYYHRCGASGNGKFDGDGPFLRVGLDWEPRDWDAPIASARISARFAENDQKHVARFTRGVQRS